MSYFLWINCIATIVVGTLAYKKFSKKPKIIQKVLFSSSSSGCCNNTDPTIEDNCSNRYCFKRNLNEIIERIDQSQHSVCLALYTLNLRDVCGALKSAYIRGVQIRIITTENSMRDLGKDFTELARLGIQIRFPLTGYESLVHHKFCIVDGQISNPQKPIPDEAVLITGSINWTMSSFTSSWDNFIVTPNKIFIEMYQREFDSLFSKFQRSHR